ncbi:50S ribosomal protein L3 [Candidatus Pacearchaeota archaeon]|nr:50S ribosomal protein L3 [Candidatus Pacearchaeota archaeon]
MAAPSRPRLGSLQFWPRKRSEKLIPSVNWTTLSDTKDLGLLGFLTYKVGMATVQVKDNTADSMTKGKKMIFPVTILEAPSMKAFSIRFHKNRKILKEIIISNDKELKKIVKVPKTLKPFEAEVPKDFDDITIIAYSLPSQTSVKKTPDLVELGISAANKLDFAKSLLGREISIKDFLNKKELVDARALTKGKGFSGAMQRFGLTKRQHKSEKGVRRAGSLGPWHPSHVIFRVPQAGQLGMFSRIMYNLKVISSGNVKEHNINPRQGFKHYGNIQSNYILVKGSVQGPVKRAVLLTASFRPTKDQLKKKYEFIGIQ